MEGSGVYSGQREAHMDDIAINVLLRPFVLLVLFLTAGILAWLAKRLIPEGHIKEVLYRKRDIGDTLMICCWLGFAAVFFTVILWYVD